MSPVEERIGPTSQDMKVAAIGPMINSQERIHVQQTADISLTASLGKIANQLSSYEFGPVVRWSLLKAAQDRSGSCKFWML